MQLEKCFTTNGYKFVDGIRYTQVIGLKRKKGEAKFRINEMECNGRKDLRAVKKITLKFS